MKTTTAILLLACLLPAQSSGIAWIGSWDAGLAAAKKARKPILLVAAAPHCRNVPGIW